MAEAGTAITIVHGEPFFGCLLGKEQSAGPTIDVRLTQVEDGPQKIDFMRKSIPQNCAVTKQATL